MSVLQDWVQDLTLMQQTVLLTAVRGPDGLRKNHPAKELLKSYRRTILVSAFDKRALSLYEGGGGSFTGPCMHREGVNGVMRDFIESVDEMPFHFIMHVMHAVEIVGYKHPDSIYRKLWHDFYLAMCNDLHVNPETEEQMDYRLGDKKEQWLKTQETNLGLITS